MYERVKGKFQHNQDSATALALVEQKPDDNAALDALKPHLEAAIQEDDEFASQLSTNHKPIQSALIWRSVQQHHEW